jgi:hypothetical protein
MVRRSLRRLTPGPHDRIYDDWFMTEKQFALATTTSDGVADYVTQLRLDLLFFETAVLPDTAVIDGWFFGQVTPSELTDWCGRGATHRHLPIELRCRAPSLEASLASFLRRADRDTLNDYPMHIVKDAEARAARLSRSS